MAGYVYTSSAFSGRGKWSLSLTSMVMWISVTLFSVKTEVELCVSGQYSSHALGHRGKAKALLSVCLCCSQTLFSREASIVDTRGSPVMTVLWYLLPRPLKYVVFVISLTFTVHALTPVDESTMVYNHAPVEHRGSYSENSMRSLVNTMPLNLLRCFSKVWAWQQASDSIWKPRKSIWPSF